MAFAAVKFVAKKLVDVALPSVALVKALTVAAKFVVVTAPNVALVPKKLAIETPANVEVPLTVNEEMVEVANAELPVNDADPLIAIFVPVALPKNKLVSVLLVALTVVPKIFVPVTFVATIPLENKFVVVAPVAVKLVANKLVDVALVVNTLVPVAFTQVAFVKLLELLPPTIEPLKYNCPPIL